MSPIDGDDRDDRDVNAVPVPVIARNEWPRVEVAPVGGFTPSLSVSVVIPAHGSQANLDRCLAALGHQTYPDPLLEVVVVDDASDPPLTAPAQTGDVPVRLEVHAPHGSFGAGRARNTGAAASTGDIVVFLDADILVERTFVEEHARWHHAVPYAVVSGVLGFADVDDIDPGRLTAILDGEGLERTLSDRGTDAQEWREKHFARNHDLTIDGIDLFRTTIGAVTSLRRTLLDRIGGYREVGVRGVEDTEFGYRLHNAGGLFVLDRSSRLWHQGRRSFDAGKREQINAARKVHVEDLMASPSTRPVPAERRHRVPTLAVRIAGGQGRPRGDAQGDPRVAERVTIESLVACPDLDIAVLLTPEQAEAHRSLLTDAGGNSAIATSSASTSSASTSASAPRGPLVIDETSLDPVDLAGVPYQLEVRAGVELDASTPAKLVELLRSGPLGVIHVLDGFDGGPPVELATAWWSRATARADHVGAASAERIAMAGRLFGERWISGPQLHVRASAELSELLGATTVAGTPGAATSAAAVSSVADAPVDDPVVTDVDVVYLTDLRFPGGTSSSLVEEVVAADRAGYRVGVLHLSSDTVGSGTLVNPAVQRLIDDRVVISLLPGEAVRARLAIVKHPRVFTRSLGGRLPIEADRVIVTTGQVPGHGDHTVYYRPADVAAHVREALGRDAVWAPVSPVVRRRLDGVELSDHDWVEVLDLADWWVEDRVVMPAGRNHPVIGRHGRPDLLKWPATREAVLAAYPDDPGLVVRVLGAPDELDDLVGGVPANWEVLEFGSEPVRDFLTSIDVFVYQHHPDLVEAFGRTILEALACGTVAVVPPHFEELFGDACRYAEPDGVRAEIERLTADPDAWRRQSDLGRRAVAERFSHDAHLARLADLVGPPSNVKGSQRAPARHDLVPAAMFDDRPTVLVSCIGASPEMVDVVLRSLDEQRRHHLGFTPVVVVSSAKPALADDLGIEVKAITGPKRYDDPSTPWSVYARRRLRQLVGTYGADSVVVWDLTHPDAWISLGTWSRPAVTPPTPQTPPTPPDPA